MLGKRNVYLGRSCAAALTVTLSLAGAAEDPPSAAFFYGASLPVEELAHFDRVVVEVDNVTGDDLDRLRAQGVEVFAYLSLGEVSPSRSWHRELDPRWVLDVNEAWGSDVLDQESEGWRDFLLEKIAAPICQRGFAGFFLDTLDSYRGVFEQPQRLQRQAEGLAKTIVELADRFPEMKLLLNRGFEVLPLLGKTTADSVAGVVAESLFRTWDYEANGFRAVSDEGSEWLRSRLAEVRDRYGVPIYVIDYVSPADRDLARSTARRIAELGFVPWVTQPKLDVLGVGSVEVIPRKVLVLYDGASEYQVASSAAHQLASLPLEYLGFVPWLHDIRDGLPDYPLSGRYAGIVTWFTDNLPDAEEYREWFLSQLRSGMRIAIFGKFGFGVDDAFLAQLGLARAGWDVDRSVRVRFERELAGFETEPRLRIRDLLALESRDSRHRVFLALEDASGKRLSAALLAPWGGLVLDPYVVELNFERRRRWIVNPFAFLKRALDLPPIPAPDLTTENGSRLLLLSIDGDGAVSRSRIPGTPFAIEVILEKILKVYPYPTTVSVIEGEISAKGLYPHVSEQVEEVAREIFGLPNVELASHAFSHPFDWSAARRFPADPTLRLPIPGYSFSLEREIIGSVRYINERLAPPGKKVKVFLWTGEALPDHDALAMTDMLGLSNLNGGNTGITYAHRSITDVSPMGRRVGDRYQIYAPIMNENIFTRLWKGPYYAYERVLETFELTDRPRRLKPIHVYFHFYSGGHPESIAALTHCYEWIGRQETLPLFASEYSALSRAYFSVTLARSLDGDWRIRGLGALRTVRISAGLGWPDLEHCPGVCSVREIESGRFVSFAPGVPSTLRFTARPPARPHIRRSNARVIRWEPRGSLVRFALKGNMPVKLCVAGVRGPCRVLWNGGELRGTQRERAWEFQFPQHETGDAVLVCP